MEESMKFNSSVCTSIEQSQRLLELGLKPETADMCIDLYHEDKPFVINEDVDLSIQTEVVPAWSLHRLLCLLYPREDVYLIMPSTAYNDIIDDIENEIKCDGFNKKYLKQ